MILPKGALPPAAARLPATVTLRAGRRRGGYLLLELILAMSIFSLAVMGFAQTLHMALQTTGVLNRENDIRIGMRSFLEEVRRKPLAELTQSYTDERLGVTFNSAAEELTLKDRNGTVLKDLHKLIVTATYTASGESHSEALEVWVYKTATEGRSGQQQQQ
ncbi:hypothetical protein [Roseimicrobium sp. ORNL1]|uniref:PulJ/GspJ family protein n=1 Tax=Roseimicrobium sp. ORNL1 TaxID=2711231 RepID=UPI0013E103BE|nr:hypothetical protein [Roseimicrobium sp. ORNL1]QIF02240.1 hypothetical protein G5S37_12110 [Roseimicrobium sp. ORNL1]